MLRRRTPTTPTNEAAALVPVFTPDPHGAALFAGVVNGTLGHLGSRPVLDASGDSWHGWTAPPQAFRGATGVVGGGRPVVPTSSRLDQAGSGTAPDAIAELFEQRMGARRFG